MPVLVQAVVLSLMALPPSCESVPDTPSQVGASVAEATGTWFLSGRARDLYALRPDPGAPIDGEPGLALSPIEPTDGSYVTAVAVFPGTPYIGRRVRLSTSVRTEGVTGRGDFWVRALVWDRLAPADVPRELVLGPGEAHLDWDETSGDLEVRSLDVSGAAFRVELGSVRHPTFSILLEGVAGGEGLAGSASAQDARGAVPRSPLRGRRASPATTGQASGGH